MKRYFSRRYLVICLIVALVISALGLAAHTYQSTNNQYVGKKATLTSPTASSQLSIDNAVLVLTPKISTDVKVGIQITKFTGSAAQGHVTYSQTYSPIQFMAVKNGNKWIVIDHTHAKNLSLPSLATAKQYSLPLGWYRAN
jgi:hypothetical protein